MLHHLNVKKYRVAKNLFRRHLALLGLAFNITMAILFLVLFVQNYTILFVQNYTNAHIKQKFVAVDASSGDCNPVSRPYTLPLITADYSGNWLGQYSFDANRNFYQFNLFALSLNNDEYVNFMKEMGKAVQEVGERSKYYELSTNLIFWHAWFHDEQMISADGSKFTQTLSYAANVVDILNTESMYGTVFDGHGTCPSNMSTKSYDAGGGTATMVFSYKDFMANPDCAHVLDPEFMGFDPDIAADSFELTIDATTLFSALSVAFDVNGNESLSRYQFIDNVVDSVLFDGNYYTVGRYYDLQNPIMTPMHCIGPLNHDPGDWTAYNCMVPIGDTMGIPIFHHSGIDPDKPVSCDCTTTDGTNDYCDVFDLMLGLLVWKPNYPVMSTFDKRVQPYLPAMEFLYLPPPVTNQQANELVFPVMFAGLYMGSNPASHAQFSNKTWRADILDFSSTPSYGSASMIAFRFLSMDDQSISQDNTQLYNGACYDSFYSPLWPNFYTNPYGKLTENYLQCTKTSSDAALTSIGVSISTAGSIVATCFGLFISSTLLLAQFLKEEDNDKVHIQDADEVDGGDIEFTFLVNEEEYKIARLEKDVQRVKEEIMEISTVLG